MRRPRTPVLAGIPGPAAWAWALYDFGYSLFAYVVFARYLSEWLITDLGKPDWVYTSGQAAAALLLVVLLPLLGAIADALGSHRALLLLTTGMAVVAAAVIGVTPANVPHVGVLVVLSLGVISALGTGLAYGQFDPMLGHVADERHWQRVSGIGVAAGYVGVVLWLTLLGDVIVGERSKQHAFIPAALIFAFAAVPLLLARPPHEPGRDADDERSLVRVAASVADTRITSVLRRLRNEPDVLRLMLGRLLYADAIGTVNIFAAVYMSRVGGFDEQGKSHVTLVVVGCAGVGALVAGALARRFGPKRTLAVVIPLFALGLAVTAGAGSHTSVWVLAPVLGVSLGTIYTVDRLFLLALAPPERRGEIFGVFNLIGRVGQALGPFVLWGGVIFVLHDATGAMSALAASRISLGLIAVAALVGLAVIAPLDDRSSSRARVDEPVA